MKTFTLLLAALVLLAACAPIVSEQEVARAKEQAAHSVKEGVWPYEFVGIEQWFNLGNNTTQLQRKDLKGSVVLVDIWTYSCINCIRTLPYLTSWDEKYRDDGLVIVGIHSPEFTFEKDPDNVAAALKKYNINYPVGLDNDMETWRNYNNYYWPHTFLFDKEGNLVFDHIGEGGYGEIEEKIQELLKVHDTMTEVTAPQFNRIASPEIYLGGAVNRGNVEYNLSRGEHTFALSDRVTGNSVQLGGTWIVSDEYIQAKENATLRLYYHSKDIHLVAGGKGTITGELLDPEEKVTTPIADVPVDAQQLYTLASTDYESQAITLHISPGVQLYSFTFG